MQHGRATHCIQPEEDQPAASDVEREDRVGEGSEVEHAARDAFWRQPRADGEPSESDTVQDDEAADAWAAEEISAALKKRKERDVRRVQGKPTFGMRWRTMIGKTVPPSEDPHAMIPYAIPRRFENQCPVVANVGPNMTPAERPSRTP